MAESQTVCEIENINGKHEFLNREKTIVVFKNEIGAFEVIKCLKKCIKSKLWPKESRILIASGFHTSSDGQLKGSFSTFPGSIGRYLPQLMEDCREELEQLNYAFEDVVLTSYPTTHANFKLQELSIWNLKAKFKHILDSKEPYAIFFCNLLLWKKYCQQSHRCYGRLFCFALVIRKRICN